MRGEVPENGGPCRFGEAAIRREGTDVTIVGISRMAVTAERAAERRAAEEDIEAELIDPRTLRPARPRHDPRLGSQDEPLRDRRGGLAARRRRARTSPRSCRSRRSTTSTPVGRVTGADLPMPYSKPSRHRDTRTSHRS
jgi:pyruvate dehydrogenase E1 component beta subunit